MAVKGILALPQRDERTVSDDVPGQERSRSTGEIVKLVLSVAIITALVLFGLANSDDVRVSFLVTHKNIPLILVILGSAMAGVVVAALLRRRRS